MRRYKTPLLIITTVLIASTSLFLLYNTVTFPNSKPNGFYRQENIPTLTMESVTKTDIPFTKICGFTANSIYLSVPNPNWVVRLNKLLIVRDTLHVGIPDNPESPLLSFTTSVDSPNVSILDNNLPGIYTGTLNSSQLTKHIFNSLPFLKASTMNDSTVIIRTFDSTIEKQVFQKIDIATGNVIIENDIHPRQQIGGLDTEGTLSVCGIENNVFYVEYYRNRIFVLDNMLKMIASIRTIDTSNITDQISDKILKKDSSYDIKPAKSRFVSNKTFDVKDSIIYILSGLISDKENMTTFKSNSVIDAYSWQTGTYKGSFYMPNLDNTKIKQFRIIGEQILALYPKHIALFNLPKQYD